MIHTAALRILLLTLTLAALGCATARTADAPALAPPEAPSMYTVTVSRGQPVHIPAESLTMELISVKDDRCPQGVTCIWAGHAAVTLKVSKPGAATQTITIGTEAPSHMGLPYDAAYENYLLHLMTLEPGNTQWLTAPYRATVRVSRSLENPAIDESADNSS